MRWPIGIVIGLAIMVSVNLAFIYIAVSGSEPLEPTYVEAKR